jgi:hypothetical protein
LIQELKLKTDPKVEFVFNEYPAPVRDKMLFLRHLVIETAKATDGIEEIEETLKWGEPSYLTKIGSMLRVDWKSKNPGQYAMYFKCTSRLVETFRVRFEHTFKFEGNRAIVFRLDDEVPTEALKLCIQAALTYHKVKHLPTLGI